MKDQTPILLVIQIALLAGIVVVLYLLLKEITSRFVIF